MTPATWAARFERHVRKLQVELGLLDWFFSFKTEKWDGDTVARVDMGRESREAVFTAFMGDHRDSPKRIALHEALHVLLMEPLDVAAQRGNPTHKDVQIEEHRAIERLLNFFDGRP